MNTPENEIWINKTIKLWEERNIKIENGATIEIIKETQNILGFIFPEAFIELYKKTNGFKNNDWDEHMFSIWPLHRIIEEYQYSHIKNENIIGFCDYLINSHCIAFLKNQNGIFKIYDLTSINSPEKIADTFEEAIEMINSNNELIY